jgi:predicted nuclease with TOPRIM domain
MAEDAQRWSRAKDVLTILVIPMLLWCVRQEIRMVQVEAQGAEVAEIRQQLHALEVKVAGMNAPLVKTSEEVALIHTRLDDLQKQLQASGLLERP